ncbi:MAG: site-specific integrase, partial [Burkholderiaceae bacterium]
MAAARKTATPRPAAESPPSAAMGRSADAIDRFLDGLWLEDGLAKNSLAAYRRDLTL